MLGMVTKHDKVKQSETTGLIWECTNLIGPIAKLTKEALEMIGRANMNRKRFIKSIRMMDW